MKSLSILLFVSLVFISYNLKAQKTRAILTFKDGTIIEGFGGLKGKTYVNFKKNKESEIEKYHFDKLDNMKIYSFGDLNTYVFKKIKGEKNARIFEELYKGKVSLLRIIYKTNTNTGVGFPTGDATNIGFGTGNISHNYYVQRKNENEVTSLGTIGLFTKKFRKITSEYFKDCESLIEKIKSKEYTQRDIRVIVEYYNNDCNSSKN
jgi:hypothetical protein